MEVIVVPAAQDVAMAAAGIISRLVAGKPGAVLGLATGASVKGVYAELALAHHDHALDFSRVTTFNLDEYVGLSRSHPASFHAFMEEHFLSRVNVAPPGESTCSSWESAGTVTWDSTSPRRHSRPGRASRR